MLILNRETNELCTANFIFDLGSAGSPDYHIGTAGHCGAEGDLIAGTSGARATDPFIDIGTISESNDFGVGDDFAFVDIYPSLYSRINAHVPGAPGYCRGAPWPPQTITNHLYLYGHGIVSGLVVGFPRQLLLDGLQTNSANGEYGAYYAHGEIEAWGHTSGGDSGAPVVRLWELMFPLPPGWHFYCSQPFGINTDAANTIPLTNQMGTLSAGTHIATRLGAEGITYTISKDDSEVADMVGDETDCYAEGPTELVGCSIDLACSEPVDGVFENLQEPLDGDRTYVPCDFLDPSWTIGCATGSPTACLDVADSTSLCLDPVGSTASASSSYSAIIPSPFASQSFPSGACDPGLTGPVGHDPLIKCPTAVQRFSPQPVGMPGQYCSRGTFMPPTPLPGPTVCTILRAPIEAGITVHAGWDVNGDGYVSESTPGEETAWDAGTVVTGDDFTVPWPSGVPAGLAMVLFLLFIDDDPSLTMDYAEASCG